MMVPRLPSTPPEWASPPPPRDVLERPYTAGGGGGYPPLDSPSSPSNV